MIAASHMRNSPEQLRIGDEWAETRVVHRRFADVVLVDVPDEDSAADVTSVDVAHG